MRRVIPLSVLPAVLAVRTADAGADPYLGRFAICNRTGAFDLSGSRGLDPLATARYRMPVRARWQVREELAVAAIFRRNEFDENRWDDAVQDFWQLSVSGRF